MKAWGEFAREGAAASLSRLDSNIKRVLDHAGEEEVHDLRTSIRRFSAAVRLLRPELDWRRLRKARRSLKTMMDAAGAARDLDVTVTLFTDAGLPPAGATLNEVHRRAIAARKTLQRIVRAHAGGSFERKWAERLEL